MIATPDVRTFNDHIPDMSQYDVEMRKSLIDKIFFLDKIDADIIVDYGCADGAIIDFMKFVFPERTYVGFDISKEHLATAKAKNVDALLTDDWDEILAFLAANKDKRAAVAANSLIHEVYNYGNESDVQTFWKRMFDPVFTTSVIRDMSVSRTTSRMSDPISVFKVRQRYDPNLLSEFEQHWGSLSENWSLTHFLLKYRYKANWSREVRENYLPLAFEDLITRIPSDWEPRYVEHYTLPFIRTKVRQDFGIDLADRTHCKLILERNP